MFAVILFRAGAAISLVREEAQAALVTVAVGLSPFVEETGMGCVTIDLRPIGVEKARRSVETAAEQLRAFGMAASIGVAATPLAAKYAAQSTETLLWVDDVRAFLKECPIALAEASDDLRSVLELWGIRTLGELAAIPKGDVADRLGLEGLALWERAVGGGVRPLKLVTEKPAFDAGWEFENPVESLDPLLFVLRRLVDRLAVDLKERHMLAGRVGLRLVLEGGAARARDFVLPEPTAQAEVIFRMLSSHLETLQTEAAIIGVRITIDPVRAGERQLGVFEHGLADPRGFVQTLARAVAIVGSGRVGRPVRGDTHRPDDHTMEPPPERIGLPGTNDVLPTLGLPLRRFRPPVPADVTCDGAEPVSLRSSCASGAIRALRGPWRSSGDWWREGWDRDEWDVALVTGGVFRLVRVGAGWFVEGEYD